MHRLTIIALLIAGACIVHPAHAAQSYDNCTGFIDSVPATISTQGVWCLRHDLSTTISGGYAITIATNNVTIDCNDFKIGGLGAGDGSTAEGIYATDRQNATVRHCNVRGFQYGIELEGGAGHLVEDNRLDNNLYVGILVGGDNNRVLRNAVYDTGGRTGSTSSYGIYAAADLIDNIVSGLFADTAGGGLYGINANSDGAQVRDNQVSGFSMTAVKGGAVTDAFGIRLDGIHQRASSNQVTANGLVSGSGIYSAYTSSFCLDNSVAGFTTNISGLCTSSGNLTAP